MASLFSLQAWRKSFSLPEDLPVPFPPSDFYRFSIPGAQSLFLVEHPAFSAMADTFFEDGPLRELGISGVSFFPFPQAGWVSHRILHRAPPRRAPVPVTFLLAAPWQGAFFSFLPLNAGTSHSTVFWVQTLPLLCLHWFFPFLLGGGFGRLVENHPQALSCAFFSACLLLPPPPPPDRDR